MSEPMQGGGPMPDLLSAKKIEQNNKRMLIGDILIYGGLAVVFLALCQDANFPIWFGACPGALILLMVLGALRR